MILEKEVVMSSLLDIEQHINGCDVLRGLIAQKEEKLKIVDKKRYHRYITKELEEIHHLQSALDQLMYVVDHSLLRIIAENVNHFKESAIADGLLIYYPLKADVTNFSKFASINLCKDGI